MARDVIYRYDGSFEGLLCCVFESYDRREIPAAVLSPDDVQTTLIPEREIVADAAKAARVAASIPRKIGAGAPGFVRRAFLTCLPGKEREILLFLRLGYRYGPQVMNLLTNETVHTLSRAVEFLDRESHLLKGFIRFSEFNGALAAEIEPKNFVLPLLAPHFRARFPEERFLIFDRAHGAALVCQPHRAAILPVEGLELPDPDERERETRALWRLYYRTVEVEGRHNPVCRRSHMPKRYWNCMTEFCDSEPTGSKNPTPKDKGREKGGLPFICGF
ncbi:DNA metabolism protein [Caproiciproducens sp. NJN-50]|uniref:TIGR03915 family putative DNA repair protein n=1 Tax=Acutalibacteraceae TaxID=3082771 RepID=UPI000FFE1B52|nr:MULTISPECIES: TIGR03915 family putative DNA repair protein [Acutalibacteraceae]QAT49259.1 DNA metabolism protein [Caproiciproducens sp. NJN-50]